jgi:hypothetical protein
MYEPDRTLAISVNIGEDSCPFKRESTTNAGGLPKYRILTTITLELN